VETGLTNFTSIDTKAAVSRPVQPAAVERAMYATSVARSTGRSRSRSRSPESVYAT
jgi:hypothetical protein